MQIKSMNVSLPQRQAYKDVQGRRLPFDVNVAVRLLVFVALAGVFFFPRPEPHRASLIPAEVLEETPDPCSQVCIVGALLNI